MDAGLPLAVWAGLGIVSACLVWQCLVALARFLEFRDRSGELAREARRLLALRRAAREHASGGARAPAGGDSPEQQ